MNVLVVEDDAAIQKLLQRWLSDAGMTAIPCWTLEDAKAYLADQTPDVLVTDIRLQEFNGLQLVVQLADRTPPVPCVVLTGHDDPMLRKEAERMKAHYLVKPLTRAEFIGMIEKVTRPPRA